MATDDTHEFVRSEVCAFCNQTYAFPVRLERSILHKRWRDGSSEHLVLVGRRIIHRCSADTDAHTSE